jgi:serine/threonine protein kinase
LTDGDLERIEKSCSDFEQQLRSSLRPRVEDYLGGFEENCRQTLFEDLLELELDPEINPRWTTERGPDEAEYRRRFPEDDAIIARVFRERRGESADSQSRSSNPMEQEGGAAVASSEPPPRLPDRFEILRPLGHGYFGVVYLVYDHNLDRRVAIKVLRQKWRNNPEVRARLWQEARIAVEFEHPNLIITHDVVKREDDQGPAIVMQYLDGGTLQDLVKSWANGSTDFDELLFIMEQVAQAVHFIHTSSISKGPLVHRDLKPTNIILDNHRNPRVVDFGLAAWTARLAQGLEERGGTRAYMSPEQVRHFREQEASIDSRSDIWSLGVILYEMLTGKLPFRGSPDGIMDAIQDDTWERAGPKKLNPEIAPQLDGIVRRCLSKSPKRRFQSASELAKAIRDFRKARIAIAKGICESLRNMHQLRMLRANSGQLDRLVAMLCTSSDRTVRITLNFRRLSRELIREYSGYRRSTRNRPKDSQSEMDEETPVRVVIAERIGAAQYLLAAFLIRVLGLRREFPPGDLVRQMIDARRYSHALMSMRMFDITSGPLVEDTVRRLIETEEYKHAVAWITTLNFTNWPLVEHAVLHLIEVARYKTAIRWMKTFNLAHLVSLHDLVSRMIAAGKYGDALEAVGLFNLGDAFPPENMVRKMIEGKEYRDAAEAVDRLHLVEKISVEDRVVLIRGMIEASQRSDARRYANRFGVADRFPSGSFLKRKI